MAKRGRPPKTNIRKQTLDAADAAVNGSRDVQYGRPEDNFKRIANLWNAHLCNRGIIDPAVDGGFTEADVALMLALVKVGRLANDANHPDSWIDIAGYAACGAEVSRSGT